MRSPISPAIKVANRIGSWARRENPSRPHRKEIEADEQVEGMVVRPAKHDAAVAHEPARSPAIE